MPKTFRQRLVNFAAKLYISIGGSGLRQGENVAPEAAGTVASETSALLRRAAAEGAVLLKNEKILPLKGKFALFGRVQTDTFYTGYGTGGDVVKPYRVSILGGLEAGGAKLCAPLAAFYKKWQAEHPVSHGYWGNWPYSFPEAKIPEDIFLRAVEETDTAVVVLGRAAGEDRENELKKGSYYLTDDEKDLLDRVTRSFENVAVVLNIGNIIDFSWTETYRIGAILVIWQGGMEAGNACADLLLGKRVPCGKLGDTIARTFDAYPSKNFGNAAYNLYEEDVYVGYRHFETFAKDDVLYPFGFGLGYTSFALTATYGNMRVRYLVRNTGEAVGREVVEVYVRKPEGLFGNPSRELVGFSKTGLLAPREEEEGEIVLDERSFCSYDEESSVYVMRAGRYEIYAGSDVRSARIVGGFVLDSPRIVERLTEQCAPTTDFEIRTWTGTSYLRDMRKKNLKTEILAALPSPLPRGKGTPPTFSDVKEGRATVEEFVSFLPPAELEALSRGDFKMNSPLGAAGNAGVMGGVTKSLRERGVPAVTMTDGPSGVRLRAASPLIPIGTLLACTFDEPLVRAVYSVLGRAMLEMGSDVLLAPGMNLHRNPLCGRNFEYFSEDPFLTGKIAAAAVRGVQETGVSACPKHFACNNQEFNRNRNDSRVSERALRELYLRGFEICVKEGKPHFLMTSYNKINGTWAHYHYELVRGILRGEWGFDGCVVTDWWMRPAQSPEFKHIRNNAYRIRAGVNVLMPGGSFTGKKIQHGSVLPSLGHEEGLTLAELQRNAVEVLGAVLRTSAARKQKEEDHVV